MNDFVERLRKNKSSKTIETYETTPDSMVENESAHEAISTAVDSVAGITEALTTATEALTDAKDHAQALEDQCEALDIHKPASAKEYRHLKLEREYIVEQQIPKLELEVSKLTKDLAAAQRREKEAEASKLALHLLPLAQRIEADVAQLKKSFEQLDVEYRSFQSFIFENLGITAKRGSHELITNVLRSSFGHMAPRDIGTIPRSSRWTLEQYLRSFIRDDHV